MACKDMPRRIVASRSGKLALRIDLGIALRAAGMGAAPARFAARALRALVRSLKRNYTQKQLREAFRSTNPRRTFACMAFAVASFEDPQVKVGESIALPVGCFGLQVFVICVAPKSIAAKASCKKYAK